MSEHTPGPWVVSKMTPIRVDTQHGSISVNWTCNYDGGQTSRIAEANARLIAAAPLMYQALEFILNAEADYDVNDFDTVDAWSFAFDKARDALKAAKGGGDKTGELESEAGE